MYVGMYVGHAARHNDVKPLLGRELMILTHDDDDDVCMYVNRLTWTSKVSVGAQRHLDSCAAASLAEPRQAPAHTQTTLAKSSLSLRSKNDTQPL